MAAVLAYLAGRVSVFCGRGKQEFADSTSGRTSRYADAKDYANMNVLTGYSSDAAVPASLKRYPSHRRPALSPSGSIMAWPNRSTFFRPFAFPKSFDIGYQGWDAIFCPQWRANHGASQESPKGFIRCRRNQSYWPSSPFSHWPAALKATLSAASQALAQVWSQQSLQAAIQPAQHWLVPQLAFCATTQASAPAANRAFRALTGRATLIGRRREQSRRRLF